MSQAEERKRDSRLGNLASAFRRRPVDMVEVREYQVGDIRAESTVSVSAGALLVGDVLAPEVLISGLVYGFVACRRLSVAPGGQIWGDVYVSSLELAQSGKINGWICTLDAGTVDLLRAGELGKGDLPDQGERELSEELLGQVKRSGADVEADQVQSQHRSGIWRQLRSEAAVALIARAEIERTFDERLDSALSRYGSSNAGKTEQQEIDEETAADSLEPASDVRTGDAASFSGNQPDPGEVERLQARLREATAAAQKYYGELLWTRAELRAVRRDDGNNAIL